MRSSSRLRARLQSRGHASVALALLTGLPACAIDGEPNCRALISYNDGAPQSDEQSGGEFDCIWNASAPYMSIRDLDIEFRGPLVPSGDNEVDLQLYLPLFGTMTNSPTEPCTLTLSKYEIEDWTMHDRHRIEGDILCEGSLRDSSDFYQPVTDVSVSFSMYSWDTNDYFGGSDDAQQ